MYEEGIHDIFNGIQKIIAGVTVAKVGASLAQLFSISAGVLVADDTTGVGVADDGLIAVSLTGFVLSAKASLEGVVVAAKGIGQAVNGAKKVINAKSNQKQSSVVSPSPLPPDDDNNKSVKDAKKLDNKGAEKFSQEKGYKDAHELKKDILRGQKDKTVGHYDIYSNSKTGEAFLINKSGNIIIPID